MSPFDNTILQLTLLIFFMIQYASKFYVSRFHDPTERRFRSSVECVGEWLDETDTAALYQSTTFFRTSTECHWN